MMRAGRRPVMAVIGSGSPTLPPALEAAAEALGAGAMQRGFALITGGLGGVMTAAARGARQSPAWSEGRVIGVLPGYDRSAANPWIEIAIPTGLQIARNIVVVAAADVVVGLDGGAGTLSEFAIAWQLGKPLIAISSTGGWSARLAGEAIDHRGAGVVTDAKTVDEALALAVAEVAAARPEPGEIGSGWRTRAETTG
jgi:uncharacterized protein (TIGR00725 family)